MALSVKICCISSVEEAQMAIEAGASTLGLVSNMPSGPGIISDEMVREINATLPNHIEPFLLTSESSIEALKQQQLALGVRTLQLVHDDHGLNFAELRKEISGIRIVQVIHVIDEASVEKAKYYSGKVDALLLDSGNPNKKVKELGGTGRTHNWILSREICATVSIPVYLAGGLHSGNVREAIETVRPFGVDLCSGVRTNGNLDPNKLRDFFEAVHSAKPD